jgi:hypothetical protein
MTDSQKLILLVVVLYFSDCVTWVNSHVIAFLSCFGRRWTWRQAGRIIGNSQGGLLWSRLLPPSSMRFLSQITPVSISPQGVVDFVTHAIARDGYAEQSGTALRFEEISSVAHAEHELRLNHRRMVGTCSVELTSRLAHHLQQLRQAVPSERELLIDHWLDAAFDTRLIRERLLRFRHLTRFVRWHANIFFCYVFVAVPGIVLLRDWETTWRFLLALYVFLLLSLVWYYFRAHQMLYRHRRGQRWQSAVIMCVNPLSAMRSVDELARDWLAVFDPLAIAAVVLEGEAWRHFAGLVLRDISYPLQPWPVELDEQAASVVTWHREKLRTRYEQLLGEKQEPLDRLLLPEGAAAAVDETSRRICPRCLCQYRLSSDSCSSCHIPLSPLPPPAWNEA